MTRLSYKVAGIETVSYEEAKALAKRTGETIIRIFTPVEFSFNGDKNKAEKRRRSIQSKAKSYL